VAAAVINQQTPRQDIPADDDLIFEMVESLFDNRLVAQHQVCAPIRRRVNDGESSRILRGNTEVAGWSQNGTL
jgi:hypothetical protein